MQDLSSYEVRCEQEGGDRWTHHILVEKHMNQKKIRTRQQHPHYHWCEATGFQTRNFFNRRRALHWENITKNEGFP